MVPKKVGDITLRQLYKLCKNRNVCKTCPLFQEEDKPLCIWYYTFNDWKNILDKPVPNIRKKKTKGNDNGE